jgi:DNA-binding MarR family transcriptional regulator
VLHVELDHHGHRSARPVHPLALQAIGPRGATISELSRRLGVSKQAAAKTAHGLEQIGYIVRQADPDDARASVLVRTVRGEERLVLSAKVFEELRRAWANQVGIERLRRIEDDFEVLIARKWRGQDQGPTGVAPLKLWCRADRSKAGASGWWSRLG